MTSAKSLSMMMRSCAVAALLALPLGGAAFAQDNAQSGQTQQQPQQAQDQATNQGGSSVGGQNQGGQSQNPAAEALIAKIGDAEIRGSDLMTAIGMLPEPLRAQQPDMLAQIALDQLVMRELILQQARSENLGQDPEVQQLAQSSTQKAQEDAMVQVWLTRELEGAVGDQQVQQVYDQLSAGGAQVPPLEQIRPQIEQHLRQQAMADVRSRLQGGVDITFYGPNGEPINQQAQAAPQGQGSGGQGSSGQSQDTASVGSGAASANDQQAQDNAVRNAQGVGMQDARVVVGAFVIEGRTQGGDPVHMIVSPSGDLLAVAAPIGEPTGTGNSASESSPEASSAPTPGEPAQSGFMATQTQPASPQMWDPVAVEGAMRGLELGRRGVAGEVSPAGQTGGGQQGGTSGEQTGGQQGDGSGGQIGGGQQGDGSGGGSGGQSQDGSSGDQQGGSSGDQGGGQTGGQQGGATNN